jgi:hypothetical protein
VSTRAWRALAVIAAAAVIAVLVVEGLALARTPGSQQQAPAEGTFTWGGVTWDCGQVNAWDYQYGAYEPDGAPIPYEVVLACGQRQP